MTFRSDCLARFMAAVRDARADNNAAARELIATVRRRHGDKAAEIQRRELRNYTDSKHKA